MCCMLTSWLMIIFGTWGSTGYLGRHSLMSVRLVSRFTPWLPMDWKIESIHTLPLLWWIRPRHCLILYLNFTRGLKTFLWCHWNRHLNFVRTLNISLTIFGVFLPLHLSLEEFINSMNNLSINILKMLKSHSITIKPALIKKNLESKQKNYLIN